VSELEHLPDLRFARSPTRFSDRGVEITPHPVEEPSLFDYLQVIVKRKWLIAAVACAIVFVIGLYSFLVTPIYEAEMVILIERRPPRLIDIERALVDSLGSNEATYYETQYEILHSRSLATQVIREQGLEKEPHFAGDGKPSLPARLKAWLPFSKQEKRRKGNGIAPGLIDQYLHNWLVVEPLRDSRLVKLTLRSPDPELSSRVLNAHTRAYIDQGIRLRSMASDETRGFLRDSLEELKVKVEESEERLNDYRRERGIISLNEGENIVVDRLIDLNSRLTETQAERIAFEAQAQVVWNRDPDSVPAVIDSELVARLKEQYSLIEGEYAFLSTKFKPNYPRVVQLKAKLEETRRRLRSEVGSIVAGIESKYLAAQEKEDDLRDELEKQKEAALLLKDASVEYAILDREAETNRQLYDSILQRMKEMGVSAELRASNVFVIDAAYPPAFPASPRKSRNLALALVLGLLAGLGAAFAREYFDNTLKTPQDVERYLGLPSLGVVPDFLTLEPESSAEPASQAVSALAPVAISAEGESREVAFANDPLSLATESYRSIRTGILLSQAGEPPHTILFTSGARGEGKSATSLNTAVLFAQLGAPVLLIDADLRRPSCHTVLGMDNTIGLTEVLTGQVDPAEAIRPARPGLFFLSSGDRPPNPTELLGSHRMVEILATLQKEYAYILIDAPPLISLSDSVVLSTLVDGVVLLVDQKHTPRQLVRQAQAQLMRARARILGVVLNRFDMQRSSYAHYIDEYEA